jgi:tRNA threonylcarbamoyladenosine biosynthesis protein TsaE
VTETLTLCARTDSVDGTRALAGALAAGVVDGDLILLTGDLGAGKTCFVQGFGEALGVTDRITSPTFTLISIHHGRLRLNHLDVYRLDDPLQILDLDLPELAEHGVTVIEWGEKIGPALPPDRLTVELRYGSPPGDLRELQLTLAGTSWIERADGVREALAPWLEPC